MKYRWRSGYLRQQQRKMGRGPPEGEDEEADIQVFSDRSDIDNKVGATAVMYRRGQESKTV